MRASSLIALVVVVALATAAPAVAQPAKIIRADNRIDTFEVKRDGTLAGAIAAFGQPATLRRKAGGLGCAARWPTAGLRIWFYNLGGQDPCIPKWGYFSQAIIRGDGWRTLNGLRIGDPPRRMRELYRNPRQVRDRFYGKGWWLVTRTSLIGDCTGAARCAYPGLMARFRGGRLVEFVVRYPAGGD